MQNTESLLKIKSVKNPFDGSLLVVPNDGQPHPGVILLHGSEGGHFPAWKISATRLAAHGYAVLAYCYFGAKDFFTGPRQTLGDIEIMDLVKAITWLKNSEFVAGKKIALDGTSRGAELALLTASLLGENQELVALDALSMHSLSDIVWDSWNWDWVDDRCWIGKTPSYDELLNSPENFQWNPKCGPDPRNLPENLKYAWKWQGQPILPFEPIKAENIKAPVFLTHGADDPIWSADQARRVEKKLNDSGIYNEAIYFDREGHSLNIDASLIRSEKLLQFYQRFLKSEQ
ncbi:alpha/beta hydrolase family protein [Bdellovibrio sp. HCB337]|uniref:alpha/beta hydrolase family protein n=1 Tax=Bdellovibrio sp. HCB337 TaxID=3394358 RepID=UPI0039A4C7C4